MEIALLFAIVFVALAIGAALAGVDSTIDDIERRRRYLG